MQRLLIWAAPAIFVMLWSTGFIGARLGLPHAEPFSFLFYRFCLVLVILLPVALVQVKKWPSYLSLGHAMVVGILLHAIYLGGVFFAIDRGMPAGVSALVVSLQPILSLLLAAFFLNEKVPLRTIGLFVIGLFGVAMVLWPSLVIGAADKQQILAHSTLIASVVAVFGISIGTIYQKQFAADIPLLAGLVAQYFGATIVLGILAWFSETMVIDWHVDFVIALAWLVFVLSLGAVGLLMLLIRRDSVARVSALFFLVPGFTVLVAKLLFDEAMGPMQIIGLVVATIAVAMVAKTPDIEK